jgi:hypothetical protein
LRSADPPYAVTTGIFNIDPTFAVVVGVRVDAVSPGITGGADPAPANKPPVMPKNGVPGSYVWAKILPVDNKPLVTAPG